VAGVGHHAQVGLGEGAVERPGTLLRTDPIVAALYEDGRGVQDPMHIGDRLAPRVARLLEVDLVAIGGAEPAFAVRLDLGIQREGAFVLSIGG
jgi:hypothetical protein